MTIFLVERQRTETRVARLLVDAENGHEASELAESVELDDNEWGEVAHSDESLASVTANFITAPQEAIFVSMPGPDPSLVLGAKVAGTMVIASESENGFWNNTLGWVGQVGAASLYGEDETKSYNLPASANGDARWEPLWEAIEGLG